MPRLYTILFALFALLSPLITHRVKVILKLSGRGRSLEPLNIDTCNTVHPNLLQGCEDMHLVVDGAERILYLVCSANMLDRVDWFPAMGHKSAPKHIRDKFFAWDLVRDDLQELNADGPDEFVSHGFDAVKTDRGDTVLYAINHRRSGSVIEKYVRHGKSNALKHIRTFDDQHFVYTPNDVYIADETDDLFFVSNDHMFREGLSRRLETLLQLPTTHIAVHSNARGGYRIGKGFLSNVNGLAGDRNGKLFSNHVSASVSVFDYNSDGDITLKQTITVNHATDNPTYSPETNELLVAGFPFALELEDFAHHPHAATAASISTRIKLDEIGSKFFGGDDTKSNQAQPALDEWFIDPGTGVMNMSTTYIVDKAADTWYATSCFGNLIRCTGYSNTYKTVV